MSNTDKKIAWVTGASTGIGEAVVTDLVAEGWHVAITARSEDKLQALAAKFESVYSFAGDITDEQRMADLVDEIENTVGPIDLALLNAGTYMPDGLEDFSAAKFRKQFEVNVIGMGNCAAPVLEKFRTRGKGHIAITSSVAGYRGLPRSLGYGASKAALINFAEALAAEAGGTGIKVQVICPGFVKTPLTDKNDFYMPMLMDVDKAAQKLVKGLGSSRFEIMFPWLFCFLTKIVGLLPDRAYIALIAKMKEKQQSAKPKSEPS